MIDKQLEIIRVFGAITVIIMHSTKMYTGTGILKPKISSKFFEFISWYFYSFTMELFMSLSGITYGICVNRPGGYYKNIELIKTKFKRLMVPYYIFGILYVAPIMKILKITKVSYFEYTIKGIFLQVIVAIFGIYWLFLIYLSLLLY